MNEYEAELTLKVRISRYDHAEDVQEALEVAKSALNKRTPKKVLKANPNQEKYGYKHRCPSCNTAVGFLERKWFRMKLYESSCHYCLFCGQALDWGET